MDKMTNNNVEVDQFMAALDHPQKETIEYLRAAVLGSDPGITEHVKWKACQRPLSSPRRRPVILPAGGQ